MAPQYREAGSNNHEPIECSCAECKCKTVEECLDTEHGQCEHSGDCCRKLVNDELDGLSQSMNEDWRLVPA